MKQSIVAVIVLILAVVVMWFQGRYEAEAQNAEQDYLDAAVAARPARDCFLRSCTIDQETQEQLFRAEEAAWKRLEKAAYRINADPNVLYWEAHDKGGKS